jgi:hypothetical protein
MKMFLYAVTVLLYCGCKNVGKEPASTQSIDSTQKAKAYFPVIDFIRSEINYVDSLPVGIMKYTTQDGITDSGYIKADEFHQLAQEFLPADLNKEAFESNFSETSFFDNTTQYASFLYSSDKPDRTVSRVDVLAKPEDVVYNKVQSIYIEKSDSSTIKKLYWKAGQSFQINTETRTPEQKLITRQVKVVWNPWN